LQRYPAATRNEEAKRKSVKREETFCIAQALRSNWYSCFGIRKW